MAKKTKIKLPKKVMGVKVPRPLRRQAKEAVKLFESTDKTELISIGVAVLAAAKAAYEEASDKRGGKRKTA